MLESMTDENLSKLKKLMDEKIVILDNGVAHNV